VKKRFFHGTSSLSLQKILRGNGAVIRVYRDSNTSLGGAYFTTQEPVARVAAELAAREHGGEPVVLTVRADTNDLLPDEDWVVSAVVDLPADRYGVIRDRRMRDFFDDLFVGYMGEGHSLSDHYKERYDELNESHGITWRDSLRTWPGSVRQPHPISADQIEAVIEYEKSK